MSRALNALSLDEKAVLEELLRNDIGDRTEGVESSKYYLADQLNRASLSIPANIAEGNGRFLPKDRRNFFVIARGSAQECLPLLEVAKRRSLITTEQHLGLVQELEVIVKMISGLIRRENEKGK